MPTIVGDAVIATAELPIGSAVVQSSGRSALRQLQVQFNATLTAARAIEQANLLSWESRRQLRRLRHWSAVPCDINYGRTRIQRLHDMVPGIVVTQADLDAADQAYPAPGQTTRRQMIATSVAAISQLAPRPTVAIAIQQTPLPRPSLRSEQLPDMTYGIEIECFMPVGMGLERLAVIVNASGVPCHHETYNHTLRTHWKVVSDGSLGDYVRGAEVVSPVLRGEEGLTQIKKVCDALVAAGCTVRRSCGLHVHVGAQNAGIDFFKNLAAIYAKYEGAVQTFLAPSRADNMYAAPIAHRVVRERARIDAAQTLEATMEYLGAPRRSGRNGRRYSTLNFSSYWQHGTVEFRHHQGTVEARKAINWVKLCLRMAGAAKLTNADTRDGADLPAMLDFLMVPEDERTYFTTRAAHFVGRGSNYSERL
jgi:hypothetical protein